MNNRIEEMREVAKRIAISFDDERNIEMIFDHIDDFEIHIVNKIDELERNNQRRHDQLIKNQEEIKAKLRELIAKQNLGSVPFTYPEDKTLPLKPLEIQD